MTLIPCVLCDKTATYTIQPEGGAIVYYCTRHYNETVKELEA